MRCSPEVSHKHKENPQLLKCNIDGLDLAPQSAGDLLARAIVSQKMKLENVPIERLADITETAQEREMMETSSASVALRAF